MVPGSVRRERAAPIRGVVVCEDGTPVAKATVEVTGAPGMSSPYTFTDDHGRFVARLAASRSGPFTLKAVSFSEATMQWTGTVESIAARAQDVRIVIRPPKR